MAVKDLTPTQILALINNEDYRHPLTGTRPITAKTQPFDDEVNNRINHLAQASAGFLQVRKDDADDVTVRVMAGRCDINGQVLVYAGGTVDLSSYSNDTAYIWIYDNATVATIGVGSDADGWPSTAHIKLAEVTLSAGQFSEDNIVDRRSECMLVMRQAEAVDALNLTASASYQQTQIQTLMDKVDELIAAAKDSKQMNS